MSADGDLDAGDFVLDAMGERWADDLCQNNYQSPGYFSSEDQDSQRWQYYRCRTVGQNTIAYNGTDQLVTASPSVEFKDTDDNDSYFWIADLTSAYAGPKIRRGLRFEKRQGYAIIQDEISEADHHSQWRMHTKAKITLEEDGRIASR